MDEPTQAENEVVQTENEVTSPVAEKEVAETPAGESDEQPEEREAEPDKKPTRAERRIRDFSNKTRKLSEENRLLKDQLFFGGNLEETPKLFDEGETEIDPQELQARIDKFVDVKVTNTLKQQAIINEQIENFRKTFDDHQKDLESVVVKYPELDVEKGGNPELERQFVELFDKLNSEVTPDGRKVYKPNVKATEVADMIFGIKKAVSQNEIAEFTGKTVKQEMERAISPTGEKSKGSNYELEELRNTARDSGTDEAWAQYFKKAGIVKFSE